MPNLLTNLKILAMAKPDGLPIDIPIMVFECMFNPETYTVEHDIIYDTKQPAGKDGVDHIFNSTRPEKFSIEFTIDGTGVSSDVTIPVSAQVALFNQVTFELSGEIHRPNYLIVQWGTFIRDCVLISSKTTYTLFDPSGVPLRAKINATFEERKGSTLNQITNMFSSPDLTHTKIVVEGDLLPLMVYKEYNDQNYYLQVARVNKLNNFRKLQAGSTLILPPIV